MWIIFGLIAFAASFLNLYLYTRRKEHNLAMAVALSFTALALLAQYTMVSSWVNEEDWTALADVVPTMNIALWILVTISILLNLSTVFLELKKKN